MRHPTTFRPPLPATGRGLLRSRWAAIGAAVAITLGAGGLLRADAASEPASVATIEPTRVADSRRPLGFGSRLVSDQPQPLQIAGEVEYVAHDGTIETGEIVPTGATGVLLTVTLVAPDAESGFVSIRPGGMTPNMPTTSNGNHTHPGAVVANSITVGLPTVGAQIGEIDVWYHGSEPGSSADVLVDIVGYTLPGGGGQGPQGADGLSAFEIAQQYADWESEEAWLTSLVGPQGPPGATGTATLLTTEQIARGAWHEAESGDRVFSVETAPGAVAFDGADLWVANHGAGVVHRFDRQTGELEQTVATGAGPADLLFDGEYLWVANELDDSVSKVDPETASVVATFADPMFATPRRLASDGTHVWIANQGGHHVVRIHRTQGVLAQFDTAWGPTALAFDGTHIWVAHTNDAELTRLDPQTGANLDEYQVNVAMPTDMIFDGAKLQLVGSGQVLTIDPTTGTDLLDPPLDIVGAKGHLTFDGVSVWAANDQGLHRLDRGDGSRLGTHWSADEKNGVVFDGEFVWVTDAAAGTLARVRPS